MPNGSGGRPSRDSPDLLIAIDATSRRPLRQQLAEALKDAIRTGRLRLPSTRALAEDLGISRGVVVDAYAQLVAEGFFTGHPGSGTHVAPAIRPWAAQPVQLPTPIRGAAPDVVFDLRADRPDVSLFPRRQWVSATRDVLRDLTDDDLGCTAPSGAIGLRGQLASYLGRVRGAVATPENLVVVAGVTQGLALLTTVLAAGGHDTLAVEEPLRLRLAAGGLDAAALVAAASDRGVVVEAVAANRGDGGPLEGLVVGYAGLGVEHAADAVARLAEAVAEVGMTQVGGTAPGGWVPPLD